MRPPSETQPEARARSAAVKDPLRFVFGIHQHQPVGNFGYVFEEHTRDVYRPLLDALVQREFFPVVLHISGPLLEWLESSHSSYLDLIGELVAAGKVELLLSGYYEPVLAALPRDDRIEQIHWMHDALKSRFGISATGLWLTERVWEPELAADLADAGVRYLLVDDRHFLVTGFERHQLHVPWRTESDGKFVDVLAIDERLRYLIPFRPPEEIAEYVRDLRAGGHRLAVFADDGEKFGGWPGTRDWVYGKGWLRDFLDVMERLVKSGEIVMSTCSDALEAVRSGGLAYLPTASYREMEAWSLPAAAATRLTALETELGADRLAGSDSAFIRGAHWRNFLVKYSESNRAHKKMMALSALCRRRGDPVAARRAIGHAQCNDAMWHGVFGGLYLPHLREAIWLNLARAEGELRVGERLTAETLDFDADGNEEVWVHSARFSAVVSPSRGGAVIEYTIFEDGINYADVLTRRWEAYHDAALAEAARAAKEASHAAASTSHGDSSGVASIHDLERAMTLVERPPVDLDDRALFVDRVLGPEVTADRHALASYTPLNSWARAALAFEVIQEPDAVEIRCIGDGLTKQIRFSEDASITVTWSWDATRLDANSRFTSECSLFRPLEIEASPRATNWVAPVETVAKSEKGLDRTVQGESVTFLWNASVGNAKLRVRKTR
ncbi:MAG TPA: alpha-amylase/4-alpha-glucanotransferase domain-containing protein [Gemmatimonadaceae bacterium]